MPEYLMLRCCMCPNINKDNKVCPGINGTPHPEPSECRFVKAYIDDRGWIYFVRAGIGQNCFKGFYAKNEKDYISSLHQQGMRAMQWQETFDKAQSDLNKCAEKKGWKEWKELN